MVKIWLLVPSAVKLAVNGKIVDLLASGAPTVKFTSTLDKSLVPSEIASFEKVNVTSSST